MVDRGLIVGFDPGHTVGIAILDLDGKLLSVESYKEASRADVISQIIKFGRPIIISTDVYPHPKMVKKLSSILQSRIDSPNRFITVDSKKEMVDLFLIEQDLGERIRENPLTPRNAHERDALAAAIKTFKKYQNKLLNIQKKASDAGLSILEIDQVKIMFLQGIPVTKAIESIFSSRESSKEEIKNSVKPESNSDENSENSEIFRLKQRIKSQENQIRNLKNRNEFLEEQLSHSKLELSKSQKKADRIQKSYSKEFLRDKEVSAKIAIIKGLQKKYQEEKSLREELEQNLNAIKDLKSLERSKKILPVKIIESFTRDGLREACDYWKIKNDDVVHIKNSRGGGSHTASLIINRGVKAVIISDQMSHQAQEEFEEHLIPLIEVDKVDLEMIDKFAVVSIDSLNKEIENWKNKVTEKRASEDRKKLLNVIDEYRAKRRRSSDNL